MKTGVAERVRGDGEGLTKEVSDRGETHKGDWGTKEGPRAKAGVPGEVTSSK